MPELMLFPAVAVALGFIAVSLVWPKETQPKSSMLLRASLGVGFGFGIISFLLLFWLKAAGAWSTGFLGLLGGVLLSGIAAFFALRPRGRSNAGAINRAPTELESILTLYFCLALIFSLVVSVAFFLKNPHGHWDAWSHWNLRARFIFRGGEAWANSMHPDYWNPLNYPLLIPLVVATGWGLVGTDTTWVPGLTALLFTLGTVFLLTASLSRLRGKSQGLLAGILLMSTAFFLSHGNSQYSDIPLGFFFLATFALIALSDAEEKGSPRFIILSGMAAGLAAWTKNEGLLFIGCFVLARSLFNLFSAGWKPAVRELLYWSAGLLPVLAVVFYVKTQFYPPQSILETRGVPYSLHLDDLTRYQKIARSFFDAFFGFGNWAVSFPLLMIPYLFLMGIQKSPRARRSGMLCFASLFLMFSGYFLVFLSTPHDLDWHLRTSVQRLFLCLWPAFLFAYFMNVRTPEEALQSASPSRFLMKEEAGTLRADQCI